MTLASINRYWALLFALFALAGCVTTPDDTFSSQEIKLLQQTQDVAGLAEVTNASLISYVEEALNTPIVFHGLVLDRSGEPIPNHPVKATVFDQKLDPLVWPYLGWTRITGLSTNQQGRFVIKNRKGARLAVAIEDDDYWDINDESGERVFYYADADRDQNVSPLPLTADTAAIFVLEEIPVEYRANPINLGAIALQPSKTIGINLHRPRYAVPLKEADLLVEFTRSVAYGDSPFDWRVSISVPAGGIQTTPDLYGKRAPETGYSQSLTIGADAEDENWSTRREILCFLKTASAQYAHLELKIRVNGRTPFIAVMGHTNEFGNPFLH